MVMRHIEDVKANIRQTEEEHGVDLRFFVDLKPPVARRFDRPHGPIIMPTTQSRLASVCYYYGAALLNRRQTRNRPSINTLKQEISYANNKRSPDWNLPWEVQLPGGKLGLFARCLGCGDVVLYDDVTELFEHRDNAECSFLDDYQEEV